MKKLLLWVLIFVFGFIVGAGVGFKVLQGVSTQLLLEARQNSSTQFQQAYAGSTTQQQIDAFIQQQKDQLLDKMQGSLKDVLMGFFGTGASK